MDKYLYFSVDFTIMSEEDTGQYSLMSMVLKQWYITKCQYCIYNRNLICTNQ